MNNRSIVNTSEPKVTKWTVGWGLTARCDLGCAFCYSEVARRASTCAEIDMSRAERFLSRNTGIIDSINFGTGECFLAPCFERVLDLCHQWTPQATIAVTTNGALADSVLTSGMRRAVRGNIHEVDVSIDFYSPPRHDNWRGKNGAWLRATAAVSLARSLGTMPTIVMIGTPETLTSDNLRGMLDLCAFFSVPLRINLFAPTTGDFSFAPSPSDVVNMLMLLQSYAAGVESSDPFIAGLLSKRLPAQNGLTGSCRILPDGRATPSTYLLSDPWIADWDVGSGSLDELSVSSPFLALRRAPVPQECAGCSAAAVCRGGAAVRRWLWYGDLTRRDPLCPRKQSPCSPSIPPSSPTGVSANLPKVHLAYLPTIIAEPQLQYQSRLPQCAKVLLINRGRLLVMKRSSGDATFPSAWDIPGGRLHPNETARQAAVRELAEETGIAVKEAELGHPYRWTSIVDGLEPLFGTTYSLKYDGPIRLSKEHRESRWISSEAIPALLGESGILKYHAAAYEWQLLKRETTE